MPRMQRAVAMIRRDLQGHGADVHEVAEQHRFRVVHTLYLDTGPLISALIVAGAVAEHDAAAVAVPSFEHADLVRHAITEHAALATPLCLYPKGYRWPVVEL
ncbi:hypothetical protein ACFWPH_14530 [Nocardia sp. NPDC058499]|uniref:hypothetical protein n=1 Tax=Nocardia sp. NPDC058499 TaxID=3346530 RepID=UPI00364C6C2C